MHKTCASCANLFKTDTSPTGYRCGVSYFAQPPLERRVHGLHSIAEAKLKALGAEALHRLHQAGALPLIYCQLLSMQHLPLLGKLAQAHAKAKAQAQAQANAPLDFEQLLHASEALADAKPGKGKKGKGGQGANGKGMNGHDADDLNWSL